MNVHMILFALIAILDLAGASLLLLGIRGWHVPPQKRKARFYLALGLVYLLAGVLLVILTLRRG